MMTYRAMAAAFLLFWPAVGMTQEARVLSGEHDGFTRLVAPIPQGASWEIEHTGSDIVLSVAGATSGFDTSQVYQLISRERVADIRSDTGELTITLGCDCRVAPFVARGRFVVMDIALPDTRLSASFVEKTEASKKAEAEVANDIAEVTPEKSETLVLPLVPDWQNQQTVLPLQPADLPLRVREPLSAENERALNEMQQRLLKELSAAATRGVLTPQPGRPLPGPMPPNAGDTENQQAEKKDDTRFPDLSRDTVNSIRVTSSSDIPSYARPLQDAISITGRTCPTNAELDVANWADDRPFHVQIAEARQNLFQEFDALDAAWAKKLVKAYLYFGFGAEALDVLDLDPDLAATQPLLTDIAHIMELGVAPQNSTLPALVDCETDVALWSILAEEELRIERQLDARPALLALNKLPVHLRRFLAPALSERLLSHGDTEAATAALRSLERAPYELPSSAKLAQARIDIDNGELDKGAAKLEDVIDDNAEQSPDALIELVETRLAANQPIEPEVASLIEAYARELRTTDLGPGLRRAHVLALARSGQFDESFEALNNLGGNTEEEAAVALRLQLLEELTAAAEDVVFLDYVFGTGIADINRLPLTAKLSLADRLLGLGFAGRTEEIIAGIPQRPRNSARQMLLSRAALALQQPQKALAALVEIDGEDADYLRAQAQEMAGAHREAAILFERANKLDAALRAAWLANEFEGQMLTQDPIFGPVAALTATEPDTSTGLEGMLDRSDAALKESETARQTLSEMLASSRLGIDSP